MNEINYWNRFMATGKIDDFLAYRNAAEQAGTPRAEDPGEAGEHDHAGTDTDYGNDFKG